jgi:microcin C transport system substrate-binding protein
MQRIVTTLLALMALVPAASAQDSEWRHGTSLVEQPGYAAGFPHFNYVNPDAPKGGTAKLSGAGQTFDTLNPIPPKGVLADGIGLLYESLMTSSLDELDRSAQYGLIADGVKFPADFSSVTYRINPAARWHDGEPITAQDVVWSFDKLVELDPSQRFYYQHVVKAEVTGEREVTFSFDEKGNRELPQIVGQLLVLPKHWWEGTDARGKKRDIGSTTLESPLGSGPYKIKSVTAGRSIEYERVPDYWGANLNVNIGQNNFDNIRYEYYRDLTIEFEAFKAGQFDYWAENEAKRWETGYGFPAVKEGKVKKELVELGQTSGVMVGFVPNLRRPFFQDVRVRRALNHAFDFEDLNRTLFFRQYERIDSFFYGIPLRWEGLPEGAELEILETVRDKVPPEVFTEEYKNPVGGNPKKFRDNLRKALGLLQEAGYRLEGQKLIGADGEPVSIELLLNGPTIERVALPYQKALAQIGIELKIRPVDSSQFINRVRSRDFDLVYTGWAQSNSPGNEQLDFWGSEAADRESSRNYGGIKDPAVDALIKRIIFSKDRDDLVAAVKALDRVMMWNQYVIPSYTILPERIAYWNRFGHPDPYPKFAIGFPTVWWWDEQKAAETGSAQ